MTSFQKIEEARYFLGLINENFQDDNKCEYCVSAFLSACYSVLDHSLQEYYDHFRLKRLDKVLKISSFHESAVDAKHDTALDFIRLYCAERLKIDTNPLSASLLNLRNDNTHESMNLTSSSTFRDEVTESRFFLGLVDVSLPYFAKGLKGFVRSRQKALFDSGIISSLDHKQLSETDLDRLCQDAGQILMNTELRSACKLHFDLIDSFVNAIRAKYPRW